MKRLLAALLLAFPASAQADTLVDHVNGLTLDAAGRIDHFTALLIGDDGRVVQLFHGAEKRPRAEYAIDGKQATLIPGLIAPPMPLMAAALATITPATAGPLPPPRPEDRDLALATIQPLLLARGITTVTDLGTSIEDWQTYRRAGDEGRLAIRVLAYAADTPAMILIAGPRPTPWLYDDRLRLGGVVVDAPATDTPNAVVQFKNRMSRAAMDHFQPLVRSSAAMVPTVEKAIAELSETYKGDRRWRIETGPPAPLPEPLAEMAGSLDRFAVLRRFTIDPAQKAFADGRLGRLAVGARADFVLLDLDLELAGASELRAAHVRETWVGGRKVWPGK